MAGCGGGSPDPAEPAAELPQAAAPAAAGTLARVADSTAARRRLGYVNPQRLADTDLPAQDVRRAVIGAPAGAVRVGGRVQRTIPRSVSRSAITPEASSAAQSCLGDAIAQTILGPKAVGRNAALAVGLTDETGPLTVRLCGVPYFHRDLDRFAQAVQKRFGGAVQVGERDIGERDIVSATIPVSAIGKRQTIRLLTGGRSLRALGWD